MKIRYILPVLLIALLPSMIMARDSKDLEKYCDNIVFNETYKLYHDKEGILYSIRYTMGDIDNRGKYIDEVLGWYCESHDCSEGAFGGMTIFGNMTYYYNMPTFALYLNNKELFEALLNKFPEMKDLVDNGFNASDPNLSNGEFATPALLAVKEGQIGVLRYLVTNYDVNLFKAFGYIYIHPQGAKRLYNAQETAEKAVKRWARRNNEERLECAKAVLEYVNAWYEENKENTALQEEAQKYNEEVYASASKIEYMMDNMVPLDLTPFEYTPSLNLLQLNIEERYAQNIEKQIDAIIEKIMRDFDLSAFGNHS